MCVHKCLFFFPVSLFRKTCLPQGALSDMTGTSGSPVQENFNCLGVASSLTSWSTRMVPYPRFGFQVSSIHLLNQAERSFLLYFQKLYRMILLKNHSMTSLLFWNLTAQKTLKFIKSSKWHLWKSFFCCFRIRCVHKCVFFFPVSLFRRTCHPQCALIWLERLVLQFKKIFIA